MWRRLFSRFSHWRSRAGCRRRSLAACFLCESIRKRDIFECVFCIPLHQFYRIVSKGIEIDSPALSNLFYISTQRIVDRGFEEFKSEIWIQWKRFTTNVPAAHGPFWKIVIIRVATFLLCHCWVQNNKTQKFCLNEQQIPFSAIYQ